MAIKIKSAFIRLDHNGYYLIPQETLHFKTVEKLMKWAEKEEVIIIREK